MAKTVLIVDGHPDLVELLGGILRPRGYATVSGPAPTEAYDKARRLRPQAIIVDLIMPGLSGWSLIEQLKSNLETASIPVVVCTAAAPQAAEYLTVLRRWGCDILFKPFELDDLLRLLAKATAKRRAL